ncbi:ankyrin, partial [Aspergillus ellipticus CBS 707.79]
RGEFPLYRAAAGGHLAEVQSLLQQGADPKLRTRFGWAPLHWAAKEGYSEIVKLLLAYGADPNPRSDTGQRPISMTSNPYIRQLL